MASYILEFRCDQQTDRMIFVMNSGPTWVKFAKYAIFRFQLDRNLHSK
jgi:hypothetical protein